MLAPLIPDPVRREDLREYGELDLSECFIDGAFVSAQKGADQWE
jgi:hypothetical protein